MDSMRSLNTSLPSSTTRAPRPEQLLQAFRTAALSVTNLYKSAVTDQQSSRQAGYQEALDDLLSFLDRENLGLQDGEGWRVRQWATERYDPSINQPQHESDDEKSERDGRPRSISPSREQPQVHPRAQSEPVRPEPERTPPSSTQAPADTEVSSRPPVFHFTAGGATQPTSDDMQTDDTATEEPPASSSSAPLRLELTNRGNRTPHRHGARHTSRQTPKEFTFNPGTKRKIQFPDFFNIDSIGRDGFGGTKRGRLS